VTPDILPRRTHLDGLHSRRHVDQALAHHAELGVRRQDRELILRVAIAVGAAALVGRMRVDGRLMREDVLTRQLARSETRDVL